MLKYKNFNNTRIYNMKYFFLVILFISVTGCSSTYVVTSSSSTNEASVVEFNKFAHGREAEIILIDKTINHATEVNLTADTLYWIEKDYVLKRGVIKSDVTKVIFKDHFIGFLEGWGLGIVSGGTAGLLSYWAFGKGNVWAFFGLTGIGIIVGAAAGIVTGIIIGHTYEYNFKQSR
jgi:hypothetical protein